MNCRLYFIWLVALLLCSLSSAMIPLNVKSSKCMPQCMSYCVNESESGIPAYLCNGVCTANCYSGIPGGGDKSPDNSNEDEDG